MKGDYKKTATKIREMCVKTLYKSQSAHMGSNLSCADLLAVLYGGVLRVKPANPGWQGRDRFVMSKGHGCLAVYAALALKGFFPVKWLDTYYQNNGKLAGHMTSHGVPGVDASTGSLGHGLSMGCGMALAAKRDNKNYRVFVLMSDGELDEGSSWEPILFAPHHKLDNLVAIVDYNKIQSFGRIKEVLDLEPLVEKWKAFGWAVKEIDGHNVDEIEKVLKVIPFRNGKPSCVIAHTIKGSGGDTACDIFEDKLEWHYRNVDEEIYKRAIELLSKEKM